MRKFKLKSLSVMIGGRVFKKEDGDILNETAEVLSAHKAGFLEEVTEKKEVGDAGETSDAQTHRGAAEDEEADTSTTVEKIVKPKRKSRK